MGDFKLGSALRRERRWGAGANLERDSKMNGYIWGGIERRMENNDPENGRNR